MLYAQGIIDGLEVKPHEEKPYKVKIPSGIFHMDEDQAAMFSLGAVVAAFGPIARKGR
ncbi:hypothetical protein ACFO4E_21220 [Nocardiopsis mangrovi]|uniref:Uncharacterized protein n=2 Tax=Nocardiopsis TaxID=2013 RepID=A0ABV9E2D7_9ACTN